MKTSHVLLALAFAAAAPAYAQKPCTTADEGNAGKAIDRVVSWASLHATWKAWRHCDKGPVADLFTESVMRMMVDWKDAKQLAEAMKDPEYSDFIIKHIKSPAAKDDLDDVHSRARTVCPKGYEAWCKTIADAAVPARSVAPEVVAPSELKPLPPVSAPPPEKK